MVAEGVYFEHPWAQRGLKWNTLAPEWGLRGVNFEHPWAQSGLKLNTLGPKWGLGPLWTRPYGPQYGPPSGLLPVGPPVGLLPMGPIWALLGALCPETL